MIIEVRWTNFKITKNFGMHRLIVNWLQEINSYLWGSRASHATCPRPQLPPLFCQLRMWAGQRRGWGNQCSSQEKYTLKNGLRNCISFPKNAVQLADTYNKHYFYIHIYSILMFINRGKIFKIGDNDLCLCINPGTSYIISFLTFLYLSTILAEFSLTLWTTCIILQVRAPLRTWQGGIAKLIS